MNKENTYQLYIKKDTKEFSVTYTHKSRYIYIGISEVLYTYYYYQLWF